MGYVVRSKSGLIFESTVIGNVGEEEVYETREEAEEYSQLVSTLFHSEEFEVLELGEEEL